MNISATELAHIFNVGMMGMVLLLSLIAAKNYAQPFFLDWIKGYCYAVVLVFLPYVFSFDADHGFASFCFTTLELAVISGQVWYFLKVSFHVQKKAFPEKAFFIALFTIFLGSIASFFFGVRPTDTATVLFLCICLIWIYLSYIFTWKIAFFQGGSRFFLGVPLIGIGLLPVSYLFTHPRYDLFGYTLAAVLHLLVGVGMILFLIEKSKEEIERLQEEKIRALQSADRIKDEFLSIVGHELRSPLTTIQGYVEILQKGFDGPLNEIQLLRIDRVNQASFKIRRLVDDILDFAKLESKSMKFDFEEGDLCETILDLVEIFEERAEKEKVELTADFFPGLPLLLFDVGRIGQVLTNLIENALKFTPAGGRIEIALLPEEGQLRVEVRDSGSGIPSEELSMIFNRFYQVDSSNRRTKPGVGLGLSIARAIMEAHGGQIGVNSTMGEGSTFWFSLPLAREKRITATEAIPISL